MELPKGWTPDAEPGAFALVARPDKWPHPLAPAVSVIDIDSEAAAVGPTDYLEAQLSGIAASLQDALLLSVEWVTDSCLDLMVAHSRFGSDLTSRQRHVLPGNGRVLVASASSADVYWPDLVGVLGSTISSIRPT